MIPQTPWFARKFNFDFPVGLFPCILERIRGTPLRIEALVRGVSEEHLGRRPAEGVWSVKEQIGHLYDLDAIHAGRLEDYFAGAAGLRAADLSNRKTHESNYNAKSTVALLDLLNGPRNKLVARLETVDEQTAALVALHPRLQQPMRMVDMLYFVAEHDDHHIAKIAGLIRARGQG